MELEKYDSCIIGGVLAFINVKSGKRMNTYTAGKTLRIQLQDDDGKQKPYNYAKLSAETCIPNPKNLPLVGFKDTDSLNCKIENLYWTTKKELIAKYLKDEGDILRRAKEVIGEHTPIAFHPIHKRYIITWYGDVYQTYKIYNGRLDNSIRKLPTSKSALGYLNVNIDTKKFLVHRLVAEAFIPNPENKSSVYNDSKDKTSIIAYNLSWLSREEIGKINARNECWDRKGERNSRASLTNEEVIHMCRAILAGKDNEYLSEKYNVSEITVNNIRNRRTWEVITESDEFKDKVFPRETDKRKKV